MWLIERIVRVDVRVGDEGHACVLRHCSPESYLRETRVGGAGINGCDRQLFATNRSGTLKSPIRSDFSVAVIVQVRRGEDGA